jgi:hypothetical protein
MRIFAAFIAMLSVPPTFSASMESRFVCPSTLEARPQGTEDMWKALAGGDSSSKTGTLVGMSVYSGHPSQMASLVPDHDRQAGTGLREAVWLLEGEHWVGCQYKGTKTQLIARLPLEVKSCRLSYKAKANGLQPLALRCSEK